MLLTDLWKSGGSVHKKLPAHWLENDSTKEFVKKIQKDVKKQDILLLKKGRYGGTFAHWKIALEYSASLSARIRSQFMDIIKARFLMKEDPEAGVRFQFEQAVEDFMKLHNVDYDTAVYRITKSITAFKSLVYADF